MWSWIQGGLDKGGMDDIVVRTSAAPLTYCTWPPIRPGCWLSLEEDMFDI